MANARVIRQNFFNHPVVAQNCAIQERYLLIGLACVADDYGRFWLNHLNIKSTIFPTDKNISEEWIKEVIEKFISDEILCEYEKKGIAYAHFPKWFDKGWFLKQRLDHPKEYGVPDCSIHRMQVKKKEKTRNFSGN